MRTTEVRPAYGEDGEPVRCNCDGWWSRMRTAFFCDGPRFGVVHLGCGRALTWHNNRLQNGRRCPDCGHRVTPDLPDRWQEHAKHYCDGAPMSSTDMRATLWHENWRRTRRIWR